jgi:cyclopropane-fatty-acyl-phospholipid synthase
MECKQRFIEEMRHSPIAVQTDAANAQHDELPPDFFRQVLGTHMKYSGCFWPEHVQDLDHAEAQSLELAARRAQLRNGLGVLELGCGWGSFSLWAAQRFPRARFTAGSNTACFSCFWTWRISTH